MKRFFTCTVVAWLLVGLPTACLWAQSADALKETMRQRRPAIEALKVAHVVGENNRGYLEFVGTVHEKEELVTAENADRAKVYAALAAKTGTTPELVGKHRAERIAEKATAGTLLQDAAGKWVERKSQTP